tara:strand:+ start:578 stop:1318 length:741 start_codon:yes stop_codon:yes gene_type:complete
MKKEMKDRVYILKSKSTPLSFMLASRNTRRFPLMYFDEDKGVNRSLRYARNQKTPFEDEQDDNAILEPVVFEDGFLRVSKNNPVLQWFLSLHPGFGKVFEEVNTEKDAVQDVYNMDVELDAEIAAREMSIDVAESIARVIMGADVSRMTSAEIKRDIRMYSRRNPVEFLEMLDDPMIKLQSLSQKALDERILILKNKGRDVYFNLKDNKKKMITVPFEEKPVTAIAAYLQTDEGIEVMSMLEKKLK